MYQQPQPSPIYVQSPQPSPVYVQQQSPAVIMHTPSPTMMISNPPLDSEPVRMTCPRCNHQISTHTKTEAGTCTFLSCIGLGLTVGCCCIPFFFDAFKDVKHSCPSCGAYIGTYKRL